MSDLFDLDNMPGTLPATLQVRVTPKAKSARVKREVDEKGGVYYKVYVTAAPEDGKANRAVIALLAKELGMPKSSLTIVRGLTGRDKLIQVGK